MCTLFPAAAQLRVLCNFGGAAGLGFRDQGRFVRPFAAGTAMIGFSIANMKTMLVSELQKLVISTTRYASPRQVTPKP